MKIWNDIFSIFKYFWDTRIVEKCETWIFVTIFNYKKLSRLLLFNIWKIYIKDILYLVDTF